MKKVASRRLRPDRYHVPRAAEPGLSVVAGVSARLPGLVGVGHPPLHFDLRTGRLLTLADLLADSPAQLQRRLAAAVSRRLHEELAAVVAADYGDSATIAHVASIYGLEPWDTTPQHDLRFSAEKLAAVSPLEFALRRDAVLLFYPIGVSRFDSPYQPGESYVFPFSRLRPRGLLLPVAKAKTARVKK